MNRATQPVTAPTARMQRLAAELHTKSGGAQFAVSADDLAVILGEVSQKYLGAKEFTQMRNFVSPENRRSWCWREPVLPATSARGEVFMARYREKLYDVGLQITREESAGRELSDSLYADLYGTGGRDGVRSSAGIVHGARIARGLVAHRHGAGA